jgi:HlyD family secretion protein
MHQLATTPARSKKKKKPFWRRWYFILGVLLVLWIIISSILGRREKPIPVITEKAVRKTILQTVSATGKVQPEVEVKISPEVAGEIIELPVEDGMAVKKGRPADQDQADSYKLLVENSRTPRSKGKAFTCNRELRWPRPNRI